MPPRILQELPEHPVDAWLGLRYPGLSRGEQQELLAGQLNQRGVSLRSGVPVGRAWLRRYLGGWLPPPLEVATAIAEITGVPAAVQAEYAQRARRLRALGRAVSPHRGRPPRTAPAAGGRSAAA